MQGASTTTSDPYMALVDEVIDKAVIASPESWEAQASINEPILGAVQGASTTTSDPYMALVDEMIDKGSEFSLRGTDDELDMRSAVEASLGYEDLGAAEQDMRIRYMLTATPLR